MKIYKITFWKLIKPSINTILVIILFLFIMSIIMLDAYSQNGLIPKIGLGITIFWFFILSVPNLILYINYYKNDKKSELHIDINEKLIRILKENKKICFLFEEIKTIKKIGLISLNSKRIISNMPWRHFYYYKIELRDKRTVYLTRFLIQKLEKVVPNLPYEYQFQRFPMIKDSYEQD